jgi:hypothetical protein
LKKECNVLKFKEKKQSEEVREGVEESYKEKEERR